MSIVETNVMNVLVGSIPDDSLRLKYHDALIHKTYRLSPEIALDPAYKIEFLQMAKADNGTSPANVVEQFVEKTNKKWSEEHWAIKLQPTLVSGGIYVRFLGCNTYETRWYLKIFWECLSHVLLK